jgi:hypothetical protein
MPASEPPWERERVGGTIGHALRHTPSTSLRQTFSKFVNFAYESEKGFKKSCFQMMISNHRLIDLQKASISPKNKRDEKQEMKKPTRRPRRTTVERV